MFGNGVKIIMNHIRQNIKSILMAPNLDQNVLSVVAVGVIQKKVAKWITVIVMRKILHLINLAYALQCL